MEKQHTRPDKTFLCRVVIIDGLGNAFLYDNTIPYTIGFKEFLGRLQVDAFRPLLKIHDELDYASWAKRLSFLSSDEAAIAKLEVLIDQHKNTNYDNLAEWLWICADGSGDSGGKLIADEKEFQAFMALAKSKRLGKGCLMRVSESKTHEISTALKSLEMKEDRMGIEKLDLAFREMEKRRTIQVQKPYHQSGQ